jgi:nitroimidazol reductase NimA-like FMN-containing flavoprotein (pyridoxamine 5'-phosphate oxidase superfamily)
MGAVSSPILSNLTPDECMALLGTVALGRVGLNIRALPVVLPVNFVVVDGGVVFPTVEGTRLHAASDGAIVAFEADECESSGRAGWSVLIQGPASVVTDPVEVAKLSASELAQWAPQGSDDRFMRVDGTIVTGRRFTRGSTPD